MDATVLVVEHDDVSREVAEVSLKSAGWRVVTAASGREALDHVEAQPPDVIITETRMPGLDGFELIGRLRQRAEWAAIPVIILTEHRSPEDRMRGLELGVEDYLTKPVFMQELVTRARIALTRARRARIESEVPTKTRFTGRLADMSIADLVQTVDVSRKSGVIHLERDDLVRGDIYLREGRVVDAESGRHIGERALFRLLLWHDGNFTVEFKTVLRKDAIERGNQAVLLEGMRRLDEWNRLCEELPPLRSVMEVDYGRLADRLGDVPDSVNGLLRVLDGRRTVEQALDDCDLDDIDALRAVKLLCDKAMVRVIATRPAAANKGPTPPPTSVAPRVAALTTRRKTFDAPRVSLGGTSGGGEARAAFSAPATRPSGAATVIGHALLTPRPSAGSAAPTATPPPTAPANSPRVTLERSAARPLTPAPVSAPPAVATATERTPPRPAPPPARRATPELRRRIPTEPPQPGTGSPGRVRRMTPPVIPFPTQAPPEATAASEPSFVRALAQIVPSRTESGGGDRGVTESDFFSAGARPAETDTPFSDSDVSVVRSIGASRGRKVFFVMAGIALVAAAAVFTLLPRPRSGKAPLASVAPTARAATPPPGAMVLGPPPPAATPQIHPGAPTQPAATTDSTVNPMAAPAAPAPVAATTSVAAPTEPTTTPTAEPSADYATLLADAQKVYQRGRGREAGKLADQALFANPDGHEAMALQASIALDAGRTRLAAEWADKALAINADSARAHAVKGAVLADKGDAAEARKHFERYLEIEPTGDLADDIRQALREM